MSCLPGRVHAASGAAAARDAEGGFAASAGFQQPWRAGAAGRAAAAALGSTPGSRLPASLHSPFELAWVDLEPLRTFVRKNPSLSWGDFLILNILGSGRGYSGFSLHRLFVQLSNELRQGFSLQNTKCFCCCPAAACSLSRDQAHH